MCYWFERRGDYIRCEVRQVGGRYELSVVQPDGTAIWEQYDNPELLHHRQILLQRRFAERGWNGPQGRGI